MTRRGPKRDLQAYAKAIEDDTIGEGPAPLCRDKPEIYADYREIPSQEDAEEMCIDCPLYLACRANAKHRKPAWGVRGGIAWVFGRQAHLLSEDERRLAEED